MKRVIALVTLIVLAAPSISLAQMAPASGQKTLAATMNIYAFPTKGQDASQQSQDEAACYQYAVQNTGVDLLKLQQQAAAQAQQSAAATGAVKGAAAGALIGNRKKKEAQAQATAEQLTNFKKAFISVCMQAKNYMVQY